MSKPFLTTVLALLVAYAGLMTWIDYRLDKVNDQALAACVKPNVPMKHIQAVFYFPAGSWHR